MKKLLMASLFVVAATASMAVTSTFTPSTGTGAATVVQPVRVKGEVIDATELTLVVTPVESASVTANDLVFDLGTMVMGGTSVTKVGTIDVSLVKNGTKHAFTEAPDYALVKLSGTGLPSRRSTDGLRATEIEPTTNLPITYVVSPDNNTHGLLNHTADVLVTGNPSASGVTVGTFNQREIGIKVNVVNQAL